MLLKGNCLETLKTLDTASVDSIVTDPPYELGFMGKSWDASGIAYNAELWAECLRVLKPGGHLLAFSGSRTYHRMVVAIEDSGFEIRDQIMWLYGSGFPKSLDVSKAIDKSMGENLKRQLRFTDWMRSTGITARQIDEATGTNMGGHYLTNASQPAIATADLFDKLRHLLPEVPEEIERLVAERTGIEWTAYKNREVVGTQTQGKLVVNPGQENDRSAITLDITAPATPEAQQWQGWGTALKPAHEPIVVARKPLIGTVANNVLTYGTGGLNIDGSRVGSDEQGRWPANIVITHSPDCEQECAEGCPARELDGQSGVSKSTTGKRNPNGKKNTNAFGDYGGMPGVVSGHNDSGGASRFFTQTTYTEPDYPQFFYCAKASKKERNAGMEKANFHPTVKPLILMRHLVKLVTPPNGIVLDPFLGSGTTAVAATLEDFQWIGCEMTEDYWPIIEARVEWANTETGKTLF